MGLMDCVYFLLHNPAWKEGCLSLLLKLILCLSALAGSTPCYARELAPNEFVHQGRSCFIWDSLAAVGAYSLKGDNHLLCSCKIVSTTSFVSCATQSETVNSQQKSDNKKKNESRCKSENNVWIATVISETVFSDTTSLSRFTTPLVILLPSLWLSYRIYIF